MYNVGVLFGGIFVGLISDLFIDRRRVILMLPCGVMACLILSGIIIS